MRIMKDKIQYMVDLDFIHRSRWKRKRVRVNEEMYPPFHYTLIK